MLLLYILILLYILSNVNYYKYRNIYVYFVYFIQEGSRSKKQDVLLKSKERYFLKAKQKAEKLNSLLFVKFYLHFELHILERRFKLLLLQEELFV